MTNVKYLIQSEETYNLFLESIGYAKPDNIFGDSLVYDKCVNIKMENAKLHTVGAQTFQTKFNMSLDKFKSLTHQCNKFKSFPCECMIKQTKVHPKYRSIDGRGNNLGHSEWGASNTPFLRFGPKNYEDGIYTIKKSVTGEDLPNVRLLVKEVLTKATRTTPPPLSSYNILALLAFLFVNHDVHYQIPKQPQNVTKEILCCSENGDDILPACLSDLSACLPIEISKNDSFYKHGKIGCLNMVRSQIGEFIGKVQPGEIMNSATSYLDLSLIYGNLESQLKQIRLYKDGKLRMGKNNLLPVDSNGKYIPSMKRFVGVPISSIWPALLSRNHNHLAERLVILNPHWKDESIFQEARRINIANFQYNLITAKAVEDAIDGIPVNETFSSETNSGTYLEFAFASRSSHFYLRSHMLFLSANNTETRYLQSDTIGRIELLEDSFDDAIRGAANQTVNARQYSDEIINRIGKNSEGYGVDLIATDIQRSRDNGLPSYLEIRRKCKLSPEINSFDDLNKIFNRTNVELLRNLYNSPEDIDFYVGGLLEIFEILENLLVATGPTFACVFAANYNNFVGGDIYYYSHPENPYPLTQAQIDAVHNYTLSNIICTNSGLAEITQIWSFPPSSMNPIVDCKNFPPMDLSAWKE